MAQENLQDLARSLDNFHISENTGTGSPQSNVNPFDKSGQHYINIDSGSGRGGRQTQRNENGQQMYSQRVGSYDRQRRREGSSERQRHIQGDRS